MGYGTALVSFLIEAKVLPHGRIQAWWETIGGSLGAKAVAIVQANVAYDDCSMRCDCLMCCDPTH